MVAVSSPASDISKRIASVRGQRVILDYDLADLYGVQTRVLLQAVRRNRARFPGDFLIALRNQDIAALRSQSVISKRQGRGGRSYLPLAFTEHGAVMAATVLNSHHAIEVSIFVVRAFVQIRQSLEEHKELRRRLDELEKTIDMRFGAQDRVIQRILETIRQLTAPAESTPKRQIGFVR